jgi:hypothetical protein
MRFDLKFLMKKLLHASSESFILCFCPTSIFIVDKKYKQEKPLKLFLVKETTI